MKIVCDFEKIKEELTNMNNSITEMNTQLTQYTTSVAQDLTSWTGVAKEAFELTNTDQVETTNTHVTDLENITNFVEKSVEQIEALESKLASDLNI